MTTRSSNPFTDHPSTVGETYSQHFVSAMSFSGTMLWTSVRCAIHAVLPFLFETTGKTTIAQLHRTMCVNRARERREIEPNSY